MSTQCRREATSVIACSIARDHRARRARRLRQARSAQAHRQSGDPRHRGRRRAGDRLAVATLFGTNGQPVVRLPDRALALVHRGVRQLRRERRRGPRQGRRRRACARTRTDTKAKLLIDPTARASAPYPTSALKLRAGNVVLVEAGDMVPSDGEIIEGVASVNESAITGESAPVIRESRRRPLAPSPAAPRWSPTGSRCGSPPSRATASSTA